jgi:K+-sensing histidine kinase KdpD
LEKVKLSNEIISSIARTYQYISRIDIQADYFEEINNRDTEHLKFTKSGKLSESNEKVCRQYVAEEYQEAFFKFVDLKTLPERMKNEETLVLEYRMKDGDWHRLRFVEKKRDENGVLTHVLCLIRSISDTKKWEHELMYQVEEARKAAALKARFLSNMSHDIRTPMNGIIGTLNLANRYPDDLEVQRKCREQIMTSSKYLVSIVNDILDMNKLESGGVVEQEIPFNLAGNPIYVERLLTNISDNAVKFTGPGGSVRVWCAEKYADEERVVYEFGCADTGIGMSETFLEHAFEPFTQENETSRSRYEGTGLGLAIAKKIVDRLDGDIAIESKKGVGTTVTMTLPFKIGEPVEKEKNVNYEEIPVEGLRALLAEDNELNMEITKFMLEDYGIHVECAADGEEAVQKFKNLSWDITM